MRDRTPLCTFDPYAKEYILLSSAHFHMHRHKTVVLSKQTKELKRHCLQWRGFILLHCKGFNDWGLMVVKQVPQRKAKKKRS